MLTNFLGEIFGSYGTRNIVSLCWGILEIKAPPVKTKLLSVKFEWTIADMLEVQRPLLEYQAVEAVRLKAVGHMARLTGLTKPTARLP